jgi:hypothetical protein
MSRLFLLLVLLSSCTYEPDGVPITHIKPANPPIVNVSFNSMSEKDTIKIYEPSYINYSIDAEPDKIVRVSIDFAGVTIISDAGVAGSIDFSGTLLKSGTNKLTIRVVSASGSSSFADKVGEETFSFEKSTMVFVDANPPTPPIFNLSNENGILKVSWTPYSKPNFVKYILYITDEVRKGPLQVYIWDKEKSFYLDEGYFGGYNVEYKVEVESTTGKVLSSPILRSDSFTMNGSYNPVDSTVSMAWDIADFPGTFKEYLIVENGIITKSITDFNIHSIKFKPNIAVFGAGGKYSVQLRGSTFDLLQSNNELSIPRFIESTNFTSRPEKFTYSTFLNAPITQTQSPISLQVRDNDWEITETVSGLSSEFMIAPNSPYFYTTDLSTGRVLETNLITRQSTYLDVLPLTYGGVVFDMKIVSVSSNRIVSYIYEGNSPDMTTRYTYNWVYDFASQNHPIIRNSITSLPLRLSDNGKYFMSSNNGEDCSLMFPNCKGNIYEMINGSFERIRHLNANEGAFFRPGVSDEAIAINNGRASVTNIVTGVSRELTSPDDFFFVNFDEATGYLFFAKEGAYLCYAIHIDTNQIVEIPAYFHTENSQLALYNGYVVDHLGNYFKVID